MARSHSTMKLLLSQYKGDLGEGIGPRQGRYISSMVQPRPFPKRWLYFLRSNLSYKGRRSITMNTWISGSLLFWLSPNEALCWWHILYAWYMTEGQRQWWYLFKCLKCSPYFQKQVWCDASTWLEFSIQQNISIWYAHVHQTGNGGWRWDLQLCSRVRRSVVNGRLHSKFAAFYCHFCRKS